MEKTHARDLMHPDPITVHYDTPVAEVIRLFMDRRISGVPVLNPEGAVVGVVTIRDILAHQETVEHVLSTETDYYRALEAEEGRWARDYQIKEGDLTPVGEIMTPKVICVDADASVRMMARVMVKEHIHRLFVAEHGKLAGVVTTSDLLQLMADGRAAA